MTDLVLGVTDPSGVAHARREVTRLTAALDWSETASSTLGLAVTEAATNLLKHAGGGTMLARRIAAAPPGAGTWMPAASSPPPRAPIGIEVLVLDRGPGMASVAQSLRDGHSTAGSPGLGLGAIDRLATHFELWSQPGRGTLLRFEAWPGTPPPAGAIDLGVVSVAKPGQTVCGDGWAEHPTREGNVVMVVDGLGHGPEAATAARAARTALAARPALAPADQMGELHAALRPTRGAAVALAALAPGRETGAYCGVGNIAGVVRANGRNRSLVSHNGTLGHRVHKMQTFDFPFPRDALLVLHSDGIATSWRLDDYPGIEARHPALVAAALYRDHCRGADDATVLVARNRRRST
jgi:anti-sigma regulatory factor (Ser/Thr protein kinase)